MKKGGCPLILPPIITFREKSVDISPIHNCNNIDNFAVGDAPHGITAADFDNDGNIDLAVTNRISNNISVLLGNGDCTFGMADNFAAGGAPCGITVAIKKGYRL